MSIGHALGRVFDIAAGGVKNAEALINARGDLRTTLDRYAFFCPMWRSGRQFDAATLYTELAEEFGAVRSAALKLSAGKTSATVHSTWTSGVIAFSPFVQPPSQAGLTADECQALRAAVQGLQDAAMSATRQKRRVEWSSG